MKSKSKFFRIVVAIVCIAIVGVMFTLTGCGAEPNILVVARDSASGTREAFEGLVKKGDVDLGDTGMVSSADIQTSTGGVMTKVAESVNTIGYVSLGSVNETVKALKVDGVEATTANVESDEYKMWRPFTIMTNEATALTSFTANFMSYVMSATAQGIVSDEGFVSVSTTATYTALTAAPASSDNEIIIKGSTSVEPLMREIIKAYIAANSGKVNDDNFTIDCQGSSKGVAAAQADTVGNVVGMASKAVDEADLDEFVVAKDAIAVVVHKDNALTDITVEQIYDIYTGAVLKFSDLNKEAE